MKAWINLLFPPHCPVCGEVLEYGKIHPSCEEKLERIREPKCFRCGKQLEDERGEYCADCAKRSDAPIIRHVAPFAYTKCIQKPILSVKDDNCRAYLDYFAGEMHRSILSLLYLYRKREEDVVLIPIPLHPSKRRKRGFDQTEELVERLMREGKYRSGEGWLKKCRKTLPQKELSDEEREKNVRGVFLLTEKGREGVRALSQTDMILLIDDVYTTGSTLREAAKVLKQEAENLPVFSASIAIGKGFS